MPSLTPEIILNASLSIVDEEGLDALTMRALGDRLGVTAMAVYRHFENKDEIISQLMGRVIEEYRPSEHATVKWDNWLRVTFGRIRAAFLERPAIISLAGTHAGLDKASLEVFGAGMQKLLEAGFAGRSAVSLLLTLVHYTLGSATVEHRVLQAVDGIAESSGLLDEGEAVANWFDTNLSPNSADLLEQRHYLAQFPSDEFYESGLERILESARLELQG